MWNFFYALYTLTGNVNSLVMLQILHFMRFEKEMGNYVVESGGIW